MEGANASFDSGCETRAEIAAASDFGLGHMLLPSTPTLRAGCDAACREIQNAIERGEEA